ncbi:MAG: trypsin-like peptidase domain-containing protein [Pirellulaceae bacterium]|nr:trypsin-like peptidase domain-containing protein [Pirellulaceae bacterium]
MLFQANATVRSIRHAIAAAIAISVASTTAHAQITLRPAPERTNQRSFEHPVSRDAEPVVREPLQFGSNNLAVNSLNVSTRATEFQQLQQEADVLERQLSLIRRIAKYAGPSIVHIEASKKSDPGKGFASSRVEEAGAGVIVDLNGGQYILTNRHVIHPAETSSILIETNSGQQMRPVKVWTDPSTDVAVMKIDHPSLISADLGNSDQMDIGDFVLAVGSPFGLSHSVTYGIISAKGRRNLELGSKEIEIQDFFQTDAAINPGNSGGPLLNLRGQIIGINTAIASNSGGNEGIGFSIPINMAMTVAEQLVTRGKLQRSYLGVQLENTFDSLTAHRLGLPSTTGALVKSIIPNSPAQRMDLQVGDVIVEFDGVRIENDGHLVKTVGLTPVGRSVNVIYYREGKRQRTSGTLDPNPDQ